MTLARRRWLIAGTALICMGGIGSGCGDGRRIDNGPLVGPRTAPGDMELCISLDGATTAYAGQLLRNVSQSPILIRSAKIVDETNVDAARSRVLIDLTGPAIGDVVGSFVSPDADPSEERTSRARLARAVKPKDVTVDAGAIATVFIGITPKAARTQSTVTKVMLTYLAGGDEYEEAFNVTYKVVDENC